MRHRDIVWDGWIEVILGDVFKIWFGQLIAVLDRIQLM